MELTDKEKIFFAEKFLERYMATGFGSMNKSAIEILIFDLLRKSDFFKDHTNLQWSIDLRIPEAKVKNLKFQADLLYSNFDREHLMQEFVDSIKNKNVKFIKSSGKIQFLVEDKMLRSMISSDLKKSGYFADSSFNQDIVSVDPVAFSALLEEYDLIAPKVKENILDEINKQYPENVEKRQGFSFSKLFGNLLKGIAEKAGTDFASHLFRLLYSNDIAQISNIIKELKIDQLFN